MVQGQVFLKKGEGWHFSYLIFSRFIIFAFTNNFITFAKLRYAFEEKKILCHLNFMKKSHSKSSLNEPENNIP